MSMSKKDFIALADEMRECLRGTEDGMIDRDKVLDSLCRFMRRQNSAFMEERWRDYLAGACGPSGGAVKHKHVFTRSKPTASIEICACGKFRHTEHASAAIAEKGHL